MNFQQVIRIFWARKWVILAVTVVAVLTTATVSLLLPKSYTATTFLVLDFKGADPVNGNLMPLQLLPGYLATQVDIIASQRVALKVVDGLKLSESPKVREQFEEATGGKGSIRDWLAALLLKKLDVKPSRESSVVTLSYTGNDPQFAATLANAFAEAYIQINLELKVEPARQNSVWFDDQIKSLRKNLEQSQAELSAYQNEKGIVATDERIDVENARLSELSTQLVGAQSQTFDSLSRQRQATAQASEKLAETTPEIVSNGFIQGLKTELVRQEGKLTELGNRLGTSHPQYERAVAEADALRAKIQHEIKTVTASMGNSTRVSQQRESELRSALAAQKEKVLQLKQYRDRVTVLTREVENSQRVYDVAVQRYYETRLESRSNQTNIAVLTPASAPIDHSSPRTTINVLLSLVLGSLLGFTTAFLLEMLDRKIRSGADIAGIAGLPVLGVVSAEGTPSRKKFLPNPIRRLADGRKLAHA